MPRVFPAVEAAVIKEMRIDRWLWAARFYRTRGLAADAVQGGKVHLNGLRAKAAKQVRPGDQLEIRKGPYRFEIVVRGIADRRGPAPRAATLYEELPGSRAAREALAAQLKLAPSPAYHGKGRPTKKDRRALERLSVAREQQGGRGQ